MCRPGGVRGGTRWNPRRGFGARYRRRNVITSHTTVRMKMKTGRRAISAPQSGMTNCAVSSRMPFQISSSTGASVVRGSGDEHVGHDGHRDPQQHEQGHTRVVDLPAREVLHAPVDHPDDHEQHADEDGIAGMAQRMHQICPLPGSRYSSENSRIQTTSTKCQYRDVASTASWWRAENCPAMPR